MKQNVLDTDRLEAGLTVELARIADSGGGEASVVRALQALEQARKEMPGATTGGAVSVDTEIARLGKRIEALKARRDGLAQRRREAVQASAALAGRTRVRDEARRRADLADLAAVGAERRALKERLDVARAAAERRRETESEALALAPEAALFSDAALRDVDRLREERGARPQTLEVARAALEASLREAARDAQDLARRFGALSRLEDEARARLEALLRNLASLRKENAEAGRALEAQWESLRADGLAEELVRLDAIGSADRQFVLGAEEERAALELEGVKLDRKVADASALAGIIVGERAQRLRLAKGFVGAAAALVPVVGWFAWPSAGVPVLHDGLARGLRPDSRVPRRDRMGPRLDSPPRGRGSRPRGGGRHAPPRDGDPAPALGRAAPPRPDREGRRIPRRGRAAQGPPPRADGGRTSARSHGRDDAA